MKMFAFKMTLLLGIVLVAPMFIPGPDGKPIMSIDDWIPRDLISAIGSGTVKLTDAVGDASDGLGGSSEVYSWRDEQGVLHYSDTPMDGAEALNISDNALEIPAERFMQDGLAPREETSQKSRGGKAFLLEERDSRRSTGKKNERKASAPTDLQDLEALANGDFSNIGDVMQNLPALLEQAKQARQLDPSKR